MNNGTRHSYTETNRTDGKLTKRLKEATRKMRAAARQIISEI